MAKFKIILLHPQTRKQRVALYDNMTSALTDEQGQRLAPHINTVPQPDAPVVSRETPLGKTSPRVLKISLGLSCNYECEYCSQRFVPRAGETRPDSVQSFMDGLDGWVKQPPEKIELWGGEPFVYIKTMKPLAEALRTKYPGVHLSVITNGSLLTPEINQWLDEMGFSVGISHDGPGQHVRGPDPLEDAEKRAAILDLYQRLNPQGRISFNTMMNRHNISRAAVQKFFQELTGDERVPIGEGSFVDAYDEGGLANSLRAAEQLPYRNRAFGEMRSGQAGNFGMIREKTAGFVNSIRVGRRAESLGQKCSMDDPDKIAVDLTGNVLTCQNVSAKAFAPNGESHKIGHVSDFANIKLKTATHWSKREDCPNCPMLQICQGSCMFLEGPLWDASCDNAFSDAVPVFAAGIEFLTGFVPVYIDGPQREDRMDIFGFVRPGPLNAADRSPKRFPIRVVAV
jgi:uncharacterized protein